MKRIYWVPLLALGAQSLYGFSLLGPNNEAYQVQDLGYNPVPWDALPTAPKNLGEEYRRNMPVYYYTCDANFQDYFGARGVAEIDKAFASFNRLANVSTYSSDLSEFPLAAIRRNFQAESLFMLDLKSVAMGLIIESLGLADPIRYTWALHDRFLLPNTTCPFGEVYLVVKRNFDPVFGTSLDQLKPSSYVNDVLYTYQIQEWCTAPPNYTYLAIAWPFAVDPDQAGDNLPVAETFGFGQSFRTSPFGQFYTGLTRDDVGGLRYLLRGQNMNVENSGPGTLIQVTNYVPQLLVSSNLTVFATQALTNDAGPLNALYPNLVILSTSNYFVNVYLTNITGFFTNYPWDPLGTPAHLISITNSTPTVVPRYQHTFGNLMSLIPTPNGWTAKPLLTTPTTPNGLIAVTLETTIVGASNAPWAPVGTLNVLTNTFDVTYYSNAVVGDYVILPTNLCNFAIAAAQLTNVVSVTNVVFVATNLTAVTNASGGTNAGTLLAFSQTRIDYFTNHTFVIFPVNCESNTLALRQGIEKVAFVRRDYDSLLSRFFTPVTNFYIINTVTNGAVISQNASRIVTQPDYVFTAADLTPGPAARPVVNAVSRNINFNTANVYPGLAGPGTIEPQTGGPAGTTFTFNKVGPIYTYDFGLVNTNAFLDELNQTNYWIWGSFDASTNAPVIYPNDVSIGDMENQVLLQITPPALPDAMFDIGYLAQLQAVGYTQNWQPPYSWSLAPNSPDLPPGLGIATAPDGSGIIAGTPTQVGFYNFIIRVTDSAGHTLDRSYSINVVLDP